MLNLVVPLPDLPPAPAEYAISTVSLAGLVACGVGMIAFIVMVLLVMRSENLVRRRGTGVLTGTFLVLGVGGLGLGYFTDSANHRAADRAAAEYSDLDQSAGYEARAALESAYAVTFEEYAVIPVTAGDYSREQVTFDDGSTQECFVVAEAPGYELRCGGSTPKDATPVEPVQ